MKNNANLLKIIIGFILFSSLATRAQEITVGAQTGALGRGNQTEIAYGPRVNINPFGWAALELDVTFANFDGDYSFFSSSPGLVLYPIDFDAFKVGFISGPGFYKYEGFETKFGLHAGLVGEFSIMENFQVGMSSQYHGVFDSTANGGIDIWNVFLNFGYRFEVEGGW